MIELQVHWNAFAYLPEYGQSDFGFSHLETSKYIYECCDVRATIIIIIIASVPFPLYAGLNHPIQTGWILKSHPLVAGHVILNKDSDWWNL
jgi:hypothetical protein